MCDQDDILAALGDQPKTQKEITATLGLQAGDITYPLQQLSKKGRSRGKSWSIGCLGIGEYNE